MPRFQTRFLSRIFPVLFVVVVSESGTELSRAQELTRRPFGRTAQGEPVEAFVLENVGGVRATLITRGATLVALEVPDRDGETTDVVLGFDDVAGYESEGNQYFGATIGRVGNRIADGRFTLDGVTYELATNDGPNHLHGGGPQSLDKVVWDAEPFNDDNGLGVRFSYVSPNGEEGYPGTLHCQVTYTLTDSNTIQIAYQANTDRKTPINLTNHSYFNLKGAGASTVLDHVLTLNAPKYTPVDETLIPTGAIESVEGTPLDFREPHAIGERIDALVDTPTLGYDHNLILDRASNDDGTLVQAATLRDPESGRTMEVWTTEPAVQFYSGNFLFGQDGKAGRTYVKRSAICLETQHYPDSVNHPEFPSTILQPGQTYRHVTEYRFGNE